MQIKVEEKQIIIEFNESETAFIKKSAEKHNIEHKLEDVDKYIKDKLIKAFSLNELEKLISLSVGKDFNIGKIKNVTE